MIHLYILFWGGNSVGTSQASNSWVALLTAAIARAAVPSTAHGPCLFLWVARPICSSWPHLMQDQVKLAPEEIAVLPFYPVEGVSFCNVLKSHYSFIEKLHTVECQIPQDLESEFILVLPLSRFSLEDHCGMFPVGTNLVY